MTLEIVIIGLLIGFCLLLIGYIWGAVLAFRENVLWGVCYLFVPFAKLVFVINHWEDAKSAFKIYALGAIIVCFCAFKFPTQAAQASQNAHAPRAHSQADVTPDLFEQKQQKQTKINQLKTEITGLELEVNRQYAQLTSQRKLLNTNAKAEVEAFNASAAVYTRDNQTLAAKKNELDRLWKELDLLNAESDRHAREQAQAAPKVVVYSSSWCPACQEAKAYLRGKGIPFSDKNVETSQEAAEEYSRLGGRGVPLILINGQRSDGFSPRWIDQQLAQN